MKPKFPEGKKSSYCVSDLMTPSPFSHNTALGGYHLYVKVLVTGGAGFIGSNFISQFHIGKYQEIKKIYILDKLTYSGVFSNISKFIKSNSVEFIEGDINDSNVVENLVRDVDAVVNFAAESHVDRSISNSRDFVLTNSLGVHNLLNVIFQVNKNVRFLQVSTDEVYGTIKIGSWVESSPILPNSPYSASKAAGELFARAFFQTHNLDVLITRCSNNYGTHHFPEKLIPLFITNLIEGKRVPIYGDGSNVRDWLHVNDHCDGIYKVLINGRSGDIFNIGGGCELTNLEITKIILDEMGRDESAIEFVEDRKGHDFRYSVDWSKIKNELGYEPKVDFRNGIRETITWYIENESWWKPLK